MTSRDFRAIADIVAHADTDGNEAVRTALAIDFANYLTTTNARFDRDRFIAAATGDARTPGDKPRSSDYR